MEHIEKTPEPLGAPNNPWIVSQGNCCVVL
jgi:hypothetical protein